MPSNEKQPAGVSIQDLHLSFKENQVLKGVKLEIEPGEFFAFLGPSGSGKSTLLRAIAGFGPTPQGKILIEGKDIAGLPPWRRNVGMVFQSYALWPHMTVRKNVAFGLEEHKVPAAEIAERVNGALDLVGLRDFAERRPSQLSGGQQQRVALARTVVVEPRVLLLDEPLSNLDANLRIQMRREIKDLQQKLKLTTIFVTHDQEEANTTSDRMAVLDGGVIQQVGSPMDLYDHPANLFVANFLGTANVMMGEIGEGESGAVFKSKGGSEIPFATAERGQRSILFRPQNVAIGGPSQAEAGGAGLTGTVRHTEFLGSIIRYAVDVGGDLVLIDDPHSEGKAAHDVGSTVSLAVARDQIRVLDDATPAP